MENAVAVAAEERHPLLGANLRWIESWERWMMLHKQMPGVEFQDALIRCGFKADAKDRDQAAERIIYYLKMAEGHSRPRSFGELSRFSRQVTLPCAGAKDTFGSWEEIRSYLAGQAFKELGYHFFRSDPKANYFGERYSWTDYIFRKPVLDAVFHFFRLEDGRFPNLSWESSGPASLAAKQFLLSLASIRWANGSWYQQDDRTDWSVWVHDREVSEKLIGILHGLGELGSFMRGAGGYAFAREDYPALRKIALSERYCDDSGQRCSVATIQESAAQGSSAGKLCLFLENKWQYHDRLAKLKKAKERLARNESMTDQLAKKVAHLAAGHQAKMAEEAKLK